MEDDRALFLAWCDGDRRAGAALFDRHYAAVARFFQNKVAPSFAGDLVQATFVACTEGRERFRGDASFRTFLFSIAHHLLYRHYDKARAAPEPVDWSTLSVADLAPSASALIRRREEQRLLLEALRRVPIECQEVLELLYWEDLTTVEISAVVGVPEGTVKSRLRRGREMLEGALRRLAASPEVLDSTLTDLEGWARGLRERREIG